MQLADAYAGTSGRLCALWAVFLVGLVSLALTSCQAVTPVVATSGERQERSAPLSPEPQAEWQAAFAAAEALRTGQQDAQVLAAFADFVRRYPSSPRTDSALLTLGDLSITMRQYEKAHVYYRTLLHRFPRSNHRAMAHCGLGMTLYHLKRYAASRAALQSALTLSPRGGHRAQTHYHLGLGALAQHQYAEAILHFTHAADTSAEPTIVKQAQAHSAMMVSERLSRPDLMQLAAHYLDTYPGDLLLEQLAREHRAAGNVAEEVVVLQRFMTRFPEHPRASTARTRLRALEGSGGVAHGPPAHSQTKIGVLLPLSGPGGRVGQQALRGLHLALDTLRTHHPHLALSLVVRDLAASKTAASELLRTLVQQDNVIGVIGPLFSPLAVELAPLVTQLAVPLISPYARDHTFPTAHPYVLRNSLTDAIQGRFLAAYAIKTLRLKRFAILSPEEPYGTALTQHFTAAATGLGGEVVAVVTYRPTTTDFRAVLQRLKGLQYGALFIPDYADKVVQIAADLASEDITGIQLLGADGWNAPELLAVEPHLVEGAVFVDGFFPDALAPVVRDFVERFRARYHDAPDLLAAQTYDTLMICGQVLAAGAKTPAQLRDGVFNVQHFPGVSGHTSLTAHGETEKIPYLLTVRDGRIVQLNAPPHL